MTHLCNDPSLKERRRELRRNETDAEKALWRCLRNRQVLGQRFLRQYSFGAYILDFYCPALKLAVELDGGHHSDPEISEYDAVRSDYLAAHGIEVVRFWNHDVLQQAESVLWSIEQKAKALTPPDLPLI